MSESEAGSDKPAPGIGFTPKDALEFMQRMWNPLGVPIPGLSLPGAASPPPSAGGGTPAGVVAGGLPFPNPAAMFAALDPEEVERKIAELKVIENWLTMSVGMMQLSIKTLELQKASLEALRGNAQRTVVSRSEARGKKGA